MNGEKASGNSRRSVSVPGKGRILFGALVFLFLNGCAFQPFALLNSNLRAMKENSYIAGTVTHRSKERLRVLLAIYKGSDQGGELITSTRLETGRYFTFIVPRGGEYCLAAFGDRNGNGSYEPGEPSTLVCGEERIKVDEEASSVRLDLTLDPGQALPEQLAEQIAASVPNEKSCVHVASGEVAELSDPRFSHDNGKKGLWAPFDFLSESGIGVYFLEPFDSRKIPLLFINGAGGCPRDWAYFVDNLDRSRFQPWFFFYPSGERLGSLANVLNDIVNDLFQRYRFPCLYVTAHSMGGLIGRDFVLKQIAGGTPLVERFISLSTPWSGLESAKLGVTFSPVAVPCWYDIQAGSPYLDELFSRRLAPKVPTFLLFGYRGNRNLLSENNDGTVTLKSQLRWEAQADAVKVFGFNQDHETILVNRDVLDAYVMILGGTNGEK
jgi:pimeloyl-ACP methyl ester carboxylesterase